MKDGIITADGDSLFVHRMIGYVACKREYSGTQEFGKKTISRLVVNVLRIQCWQYQQW